MRTPAAGRLRAMAAAGAAMMCLAGTGGCQKTFWVRQYPGFYTAELKTVAVLPFANRTGQKGSGMLIAAHLATDLRANGTYAVIGPAELHNMLEAKGVEFDKLDGNSLLAEVRKLGTVQACITGVVLEDGAWQYPHGIEEDYDVPARPALPADAVFDVTGPATATATAPDSVGPALPSADQGAEFYSPEWSADETDYWWGDTTYIARARVSAGVSVVRLANSSVLYTSPEPFQATVTVGYELNPPPLAAVRNEAINRVVRKIVGRVAIVPVKVSVQPDRDFRVAAGKQGGQWVFRDESPASAAALFVVLSLPDAAERNPFVVTVTPRGRPETVLARSEFLWRKDLTAKGIELPAAKIAAAGGGDCQVNFLAGGAVVMSRDLRIR